MEEAIEVVRCTVPFSSIWLFGSYLDIVQYGPLRELHVDFSDFLFKQNC